MSDSDQDVRRERRALLAFALLAGALLLVGLLAAAAFTAGEPRRGDGMIPPPEGAPAAPDEPEGEGAGPRGGHAPLRDPGHDPGRLATTATAADRAATHGAASSRR